jgi:RNA polymerase sigma factor (sigma-70 family)
MGGQAVVTEDDHVGDKTSVHGVADADAAFAALFAEEFENVFRTIYRIVGEKEAARDATQEAFARAYAHWKRVSTLDRPGAWVRRVAIRIAVHSVRGLLRQQRIAQRLHEPPAETEANPDLHRALLSLPRVQRAAIVLHYFEGRPIVEVGELLDCSEGAAKVRLHRARKRLGELLGEEVDE